MNILVIDDEQPLLSLLALNLRAAGHHVEEALSGEAGMRILEEKKGDEAVEVVITDYNMPKMTGIDVLKTVKVAHPHVAVGVMSGQMDENIKRDALDNGAVVALQKPFTVEVLSRQLMAALHAA